MASNICLVECCRFRFNPDFKPILKFGAQFLSNFQSESEKPGTYHLNDNIGVKHIFLHIKLFMQSPHWLSHCLQCDHFYTPLQWCLSPKQLLKNHSNRAVTLYTGMRFQYLWFCVLCHPLHLLFIVPNVPPYDLLNGNLKGEMLSLKSTYRKRSV